MLVDIYLDVSTAYTSKVEAMILEINEAIQDRNPNRSACSYSSFGDSEQYSPSEIEVRRKERRNQRRLELIKEKKEREKKYEGVKPKEPIVKFETEPLYLDEYTKYVNNNEAGEQLKRELAKPSNYHYRLIHQRREEDPENYERCMEDEESDYPSEFFTQ
jgi:hypothetical protein